MPSTRMDTDTADVLIADAVGMRLHLGQFAEQMLVQMLLPLSVLYLVPAHSVAAAANVMSVPRPFTCIAALIFGIAQVFLTTPLVVFVAWSLPGALDGASPATAAVLRADVIVVAAGFIMHRLAISIKYGFQSRAVYAGRMSRWATMQDRLDDQLFASWFVLSRDTIAREIRTAMTLLDDDEGDTAFTPAPEAFALLRSSLHSDARAYLDSACASTPKGSSQQHTVPVSVLASALLLNVNSETGGLVLMLQRVTTVFGIVATFGTTILRACLSLPLLGENFTEGVVIVAHWVADFLLLPVVFTFLAVGLVDHTRRTRVMDGMARLFRPSPLRLGAGTVGLLATAVRPPVLSLASVADMRAFLALRRLLLAFGSGFHVRLVTVLSADLCVLAAVAAVSVLEALTAPVTDGSGTILSPVLLFFILVVPGVALCALGLFAAAAANFASSQLVSVVVQARFRLRATAFDSGIASPPQTLALFSLLDDMERALRENTPPITIFGVAATPALASSLVGAFVSIATVLVSGSITRLSSADPTSSALVPVPPVASNVTVTVSPTTSPGATAGDPGSLLAPPGVIVGSLLGVIAGAGLLVGGCKACSARRSARGANAEKKADARPAALSSPAGLPMTVAYDNPLVATNAQLPNAPPAELPAGWREVSDDSGDVWFEHEDGRSQWEQPTAASI